MQEDYIQKYPNQLDDEIDLRELFHVLVKGKWMIVSITTFVSILGVIYSLLLPNIYESKAILVPVNPSSNISGAMRGYGNLAGFAGINFPYGSYESNSMKALEKINSLSFFENNILDNIYLPNLMALKSWNSKTDTVVLNDDIYDAGKKIWIEGHPPSAQKSFRAFKSKLSLSLDKNTGFITLAIKHQSPSLAKQWTELVVNEVNHHYRQKDKLESEKAVSYLNKQISITDLSEIKQVLAELLQEETKKLTLIEANQFYVFDYIDPPAVMENKSAPRRSFICIIFALFGGMLSIFSVLIRHYTNSRKDS